MPTQRKKRPTLAERFPALQSWLVPIGILIVSIALIVAIHAGWFRFTIMPGNDFLITLAAMNFLLYAWVRTFSQWSMNGQIIAIVALVAAQAGVHQLVRLDGFAGDGRPIWTWSWRPTPQQALAEHQQRSARVSADDKPVVDLRSTTSYDSAGFRGKERDGISRAEPFALDWQANPPRKLWRHAIGSGWSSFAVVGDYCVTHEQRGEREATVCCGLKTGREIWAHLEQARFHEPTSAEGPRATPTIHDGRVYSLGATGILNCLDGATGKPRWTVNILKDNTAENRLFGVTGSPLIVGPMVIVNSGGRGSSLAAYDIDSGERIWRAGNAGASYSSPHFADLCGVEQVLDFNADGLCAHELATGKPLWEVPWISNPAERNNVCQPVVLKEVNGHAGDFVFIASGYGMGCALFEITKRDEQFQVTERWRNRNLKAKFSSVVLHEGYIYGLDEAILTCIEVETGRRCWKGGRYNYGQLILAGSSLVVQLEVGEVAVVDATPKEFRERSRFAALSARTWNAPVLAGRYLLVRNDREAACYELQAAEK
jgi:outer membrane protein assembly factor BamB